jgi:hypothetical protein
MRILPFISVPLLAILISGCATTGKSTLLGSGIGAGLGAGVGAIANGGPSGRNRIRNVFIGATAGSLLGAGAGYLAQDLIEKREQDAFDKGKKEGQRPTTTYGGEPGQPVLIPPRVEARYVEDQVRGNTFVPAHFEYQIVEPARWSR